jgi:hypothetical protein
MRIILSRKGFDSAAGGYPSPFFRESGRLLSFPIPEDNGQNDVDTGKTYADLRFDDKSSYLDIMKQLGINKFINRYVHLDPDINFTVFNNRQSDWRGLFGQSSSAQSHLRNKGVNKCDLFLFFGWFRDVVKTNNGYKYVAGTDRHIIWGYMQIDEVESIKQEENYDIWKLDHPHYFYREREMNTGYVARKNLSFAPHRPGYGTLDFKDHLVLTCPGQKKRSVWKLPEYFHPDYGTKVSYHEKLYDKSNNPIWESHDSYCILNSVGRGQEFVIEGNNDVIKWAENLVI